MPKNDFKLIEELVITVDKIGYDKTLEVIRNSRNLAKNKDIVLQEYIIQQVCSSFSFSKNELLDGNSNGDRINAIAICSYLLKKNLDYSQSKIGAILKKDDSVISKYIKKVNLLNENYKQDILILDKINIIQSKFREFKINII